MKDRTRFLAVLGAVSVLCAAAAGAAVVTGAAGPSHEAEPLHAEAEPPTYTVAELDGAICVYYMGELLYRTEIPVYGLREADRAQLREGVAARTYNEVLSLLEDFSS